MTFRILSLDGGGVWALIQVRALLEIYGAEARGHEVLAKFDLAVANSGGSLVLGGLVENLPLATILSYFEDDGVRRSLFQPTKRIVDRLIEDTLKFGPKYDAKAKLPALQRLLPARGQLALPEAAAGVLTPRGEDIHLLVTAFDYDRNLAAFFRSAPTGGQWGQGAVAADVTLAEAIHASSNAPVDYFDEPAAFNGQRYWDGAVAGYNNPVLAGVAEAVMLGVAPSEVRALALGTGTVRLAGPPADDPGSPLTAARSPQDLRDDLAKLSGAITDDPPDAASFLVHVMTGGASGLAGGAQSRIVRLNPLVSPLWDAAQKQWRPPADWTAAQFGYLAGLQLDAIEPFEVTYITRLAQSWIAGEAMNQPLRMDVDTLEAELGYTTFAAGVAAWNQVGAA